MFMFSVAYLLLNAASYDGEILHTDAWRPCAGLLLGFYARQHICYSAYMLSPVRLSVCPSVTRVYQSKTV